MDSFLDRAKALGCDGVSLESCFFPEFGAEYLTGLRRKLDAFGFDRVYAWGHPDGLEAGGSVAAKEEMIAHIEHARLIGAPVMRVVGSSLMYRFEPHEPQLAILADWFREATDVAAKHGIRLAVENHIDYNSDEILWLIERAGSENFGINLDTANFLRVLDDPVEATRKLAKHVYATHVKDIEPVKGVSVREWYYFSCVAAGEGLIEIDRIARILKDAGYEGFPAFETDMPHPDYAEREEEILAYQKHNIVFFAFWGSHPEAFALFRKYKLHPQIWQMIGGQTGATEDEMVASAAKAMEGLAKETAELGCKLALYNHGGWAGEPKNMVAVCERLRAMGYPHVGIVYNFLGILFALALGASIVVCLELGRCFGARRLAKEGEAAAKGFGAIESAGFVLLGLILAFSFSGALSRFDARRHLTITETRKIHSPPIILIILGTLSLACSLFAGYDVANRKRLNLFHSDAFTVALAMTVYVIIDLEYPRIGMGMIRLTDSDQVLVELRESMDHSNS